MSKDMCSNSGLNNTLSRFQRANLEKAAATRVQALSVRTRSVLSAEISKIKAFESSEISNARHAQKHRRQRTSRLVSAGEGCWEGEGVGYF
jgi:hypothetical protein